MVIEQIKHQLGRLVPVHKVSDLTMEGPFLARELALVKVAGTGEKRVEALRVADIFRARAVDTSKNSFVGIAIVIDTHGCIPSLGVSMLADFRWCRRRG